MQPVPRIFVSATSRDLRTARGLVAEGLRRMECLPIVQDDFPPDYKSVRDMLRTKISTCNAVVHLAGFYYGAEPQPVFPGPDRRSFTQMEYEIAMELKLPTYVFLCGRDFPFDPHDPEPEEKQQLQLAHRQRLLQRDELFYEFASPEELANRTRELQLSVENLREELARERGRRRIAMVSAVSALVVAVGGGYFLFGKQKKQEVVIAETTAKVEAQGALIAQLLAEQARLRKAEAGSPEEITRLAEQNVAKANNQTVEDVRRGVEKAIADAKSAVASAGEDKAKRAAALRQLADAERAAGHENEMIDAIQKRLTLIDRDKEPVVWASAAGEVVAALIDRDAMNQQARTLIREAMTWAKQNPALGPNHPTTLYLMVRFARVPTSTKETTAESIAIYREVLKVRERDLGPDHPDTVDVVDQLARALSFSGTEFQMPEQQKESETLFRRVLATREKQLGDQHEETVNAKIALAFALARWGRYPEAEVLNNQVLDLRTKTVGPDHPATVTAMQHLAITKSRQKDYASAIALSRRTLEIRERTLGPEASDTVSAMDILESMLARTKDPTFLDEREKLSRRALDIRIRTIGAGQPDTLGNFANLETVLKEKGDVKGARKVTLQRLEEQGKAVGDDEGFAYDLYVVATDFYIANDRAAALPLAERSVAIYEKLLGPDAPQVNRSLYVVAGIQHANDDLNAAEKSASRLVDSLKRKPPQDPEDLKSAESLLKEVRGQLAKAAALKDGSANTTEKPAMTNTPAATRAPLGESASAAPAKASATPAPPPSLEGYAKLRQSITDRAEKDGWKNLRTNLPGSTETRRVYVRGWFEEGSKLRKAMKVDATGENDGTFTAYYYSQGWLTSVYRMREGKAVPIDGVKKATDTYNFWNGKLVGWKRTQDDAEKLEDAKDNDFEALGKKIKAEADAATAPLLEMLKKN